MRGSEAAGITCDEDKCLDDLGTGGTRRSEQDVRGAKFGGLPAGVEIQDGRWFHGLVLAEGKCGRHGAP